MVRYLLKRLGRGILTILLSVTLVFFIVRAMPSNPVDLMVSPQMSEEAQQALIEEFGLDQSKLTQYGLYMKELLHGNLGSSFAKRIPVSQYIAEKLPWTLLLLAAVMLIVILIGISVGLYAAAHKGKLSDRVISVLVTMGISVFIPFMAFLLLYIFSFKLKLLPTGGAYTPPKGTGWSYYGDVAKHLILPAIALSITNLANAVLYTRNSMIDVLHEDYIRTAYAKGNNKGRVLRVHALKNALIPTVTVIGMQIGFMVGGATVTETVFSWPGIGRMVYDAVNALDYPVLQGAFLVMAVAVVIMSFLTDLVVAWAGSPNQARRLIMKERKGFLYYFVRNRNGMIGMIGVLLILLIGLVGPMLIAKPDGYTQDILQAPSALHWLGTDNIGLDIFAELVWGARTSLYVSVMAMLIAGVIGIPVGLLCGYNTGWLREVIDGFIDIFMTLPMLPLMIIIAAVMGTSITNVAIILGIFSWPQLARVTKNSTMKIREMQYIEACTCLGLSKPRILFKHILINATGPVFVNMTLVMASAVLTEASLSFLGLGDPTTWSWGTMLKRAWGQNAVISSPNPWWWWLLPSLCIVVYVVCFNLLGTAINDSLSPKSRE